MSSADAAPPAPTAPTGEHDPATPNITIEAQAPDQKKEKKVHVNHKGWDGKLRVDKKALRGEGEGDDDAADAQSDAEESDEELEGPDPEQLEADEDLLDGVPDDEEEIDLVHCRVSSMPALRLERFTQLKRLCLRQNQIGYIELPEELVPALQELDMYDNLIAHIKGLEAFTNLESLDLSFNKIKHIKRVNHLTKLRDLYFVQNKISTIEGLEGLVHLRNLELGANRVREIQNLETLAGLEELWLGKNKITEIKGLDALTNLRLISIQSNRLTNISGLSKLKNLEELHISHNLITELSGLEANTNLRVIDISSNPIEHLTGLDKLTHLEELWASNTKISSFNEVEKQLRDKEELQTVYFEGTPLQKAQPALYRNKVRLALPQIRQIDATLPTYTFSSYHPKAVPVLHWLDGIDWLSDLGCPACGTLLLPLRYINWETLSEGLEPRLESSRSQLGWDWGWDVIDCCEAQRRHRKRWHAAKGDSFGNRNDGGGVPVGGGPGPGGGGRLTQDMLVKRSMQMFGL